MIAINYTKCSTVMSFRARNKSRQSDPPQIRPGPAPVIPVTSPTQPLVIPSSSCSPIPLKPPGSPLQAPRLYSSRAKLVRMESRLQSQRIMRQRGLYHQTLSASQSFSPALISPLTTTSAAATALCDDAALNRTGTLEVCDEVVAEHQRIVFSR
jgi:hypothetical protein